MYYGMYCEMFNCQELTFEIIDCDNQFTTISKDCFFEVVEVDNNKIKFYCIVDNIKYLQKCKLDKKAISKKIDLLKCKLGLKYSI